MKTIKNFVKSHKKLILFLICVAVFLALVIFFINRNSNNTAIKTQKSVVKKGSITSSISAFGNIQTANYLAVTTSANGIVKSVFVKEGDKVAKGTKIMEITLDLEGEKSKISAYSSYLKAKISLENAKNSLYTYENSLNTKKVALKNIGETTSYVSRDEMLSYDIALNDYAKAKKDLELQKESIKQLELSVSTAWLDYTAQSDIITAPTDGIIANVIYVEGTKIENSVSSERSIKTLASIKKEGTPIVSVNVNELDITKVKVGQRAIVKLQGNTDKIFEGTISGIDKIGSVQSGVSNYPVIIKLTKDSEEILPNMSVAVDIIVNEKNNVLLVPTSSITKLRNRSFVNVIRNEKEERVSIEIGLSDSDSTEIISGLNEGDVVTIKALPTTGFTTTMQNQNSQRNVSGFGNFTTLQRR